MGAVDNPLRPVALNFQYTQPIGWLPPPLLACRHDKQGAVLRRVWVSLSSGCNSLPFPEVRFCRIHCVSVLQKCEPSRNGNGHRSQERPNSQENRSRVNPLAANIAAIARKKNAARDAAWAAAEEAAANEPASVKQAREEADALHRKKEIGRLLGALKGIYGPASQEPGNTTAGSHVQAQAHKVADEIFQAEAARCHDWQWCCMQSSCPFTFADTFIA